MPSIRSAAVVVAASSAALIGIFSPRLAHAQSTTTPRTNWQADLGYVSATGNTDVTWACR